MLHVQVKGDIGSDPSWWINAIKDKLSAATELGWQIRALGEQPGPGCLAPIADAEGTWDGGVMITTTTPAAITARPPLSR